MSFKSVVTHRSVMSMSTPSEHAPHWAEIICLHICLTSESGCLWKAEASGLTHVCILSSTTWLCIHLHVHWRDQVKSHEEMLRASGKSLHHLQTSWRGHCDKKKSPCLRLSWPAITSIISFTATAKPPTSSSQLCNMKHHEGKHSVCLSRLIWPWNLLEN